MTTRVLIAHEDALIAAGCAAILRTRPQFAVELQDSKGHRLAGLSREMDVVIASYDVGMTLCRELAQPRRILVVVPCSFEHQVRTVFTAGLGGYFALGGDAEEFVRAVSMIARGDPALSDSAARRLAESLSKRDLTSRELAILALLARGMSNKAIANHFCLAVGTVKSHVKSIISKLDARGRTEAAAIAFRRGLVSVGEISARPRNPVDFRGSVVTDLGLRLGDAAHELVS
jgi:DNA-binding NarL/FixJ family response regulator